MEQIPRYGTVVLRGGCTFLLVTHVVVSAQGTEALYTPFLGRFAPEHAVRTE